MTPLEDIYGPKFFARRHRLAWRCPILCNIINKVFEPKSIIDVGCAIGDYVQYWRNLGINAVGIEGSESVLPYALTDKIYICDLRTEIVRHHADLAVCLEVAEHIEIEYADIFIENLVRMSSRILMSAAPPGAGGHHHVNCQPKSYWIEKMLVHDYEYNPTVVTMLQFELRPWRHRKELYHNNLMFFQKREEQK
jgi:hypothetical protein